MLRIVLGPILEGRGEKVGLVGVKACCSVQHRAGSQQRRGQCALVRVPGRDRSETFAKLPAHLTGPALHPRQRDLELRFGFRR